MVAFKFGERDSTLVDGLANDDGGDIGGFELKYIHHTTDATGSNDIKVGELCHHILIELGGRTSHHTITRNVSRDDLANATGGVALKERLPTGIALLEPALDGDATILDIGTEDNTVGTILLQPSQKELGTLDSNRAAGNHLCSTLESDTDIIVALQATTKIDDEIGFGRDLFEYPMVDDVTAFRSIEIDKVKTTDADIFKLKGRFKRVLTIFFLSIIVAFGEANKFAVDDVNGGYYLNHDKKLRKICSPTGPDFSGWNCVAQKLSLWRAAL